MLMKLKDCLELLVFNREYSVSIIQPWDNNSISESKPHTLVQVEREGYYFPLFVHQQEGILMAPTEHILVEVVEN